MGFWIVACVSFLKMSACGDAELRLVRDFDVTWQIEGPGSPNTVVAAQRNAPDGSLFVVFNRDPLPGSGGDYLVWRISAQGERTGTRELPTGYALAALFETRAGGYTFVMNQLANPNEFIRITLGADFSFTQTTFTFERPATFHVLNFSEDAIFFSVFEDPHPGVRTIALRYTGQVIWDKRIEEEHIKPFPILDSRNLLYIRTNNDDAHAITSRIPATGEVRWARNYTAQELFGLDLLSFSTSPALSLGALYTELFSVEERGLYIANLSTADGSVLRSWKVVLPDEVGAAHFREFMNDGGILLQGAGPGRTTLLKTDREGRILWTGNFIPGANGLEASNGDLWVVSPVTLYRLRAIL